MKKIARLKALVYLVYFALVSVAVGYVANEKSGRSWTKMPKSLELQGGWTVIARHDYGRIVDLGDSLRLSKVDKLGEVLFQDTVLKEDLVTGIPTDRLKASNISYVMVQWGVPLGKVIYIPELTDEAKTEWAEDCSSHMKKGWLVETYGPSWLEH